MKTNVWLPEGNRGRRDKPGVWDEHTHTTIYETDDRQGSAVWRWELYPVICNNLEEKESEKE